MKEELVAMANRQARAWLVFADQCLGDLYKGIAIGRSNDWYNVAKQLSKLEYLPTGRQAVAGDF